MASSLSRVDLNIIQPRPQCRICRGAGLIPFLLSENSSPVIRKATKSLPKGFSEDHWLDWIYLVLIHKVLFPQSLLSASDEQLGRSNFSSLG